ncbi:MAG: hypothetical protein AAF149_13725 [Bacteroidota bacterium]
MKITQLFTVVICVLTQYSGYSQAMSDKVDFDSFSQFDLEGGYSVGSIISVKKNRISSPRFELKEYKQSIGDQKLLKLTKDNNIPSHTFNKNEVEKARIKAFLKLPDIEPELEAAFNNLSTVSLKVEKGSRHYFSGGGNTFRRVVRKIQKSENCDMFDFITENKARFISEILIYNEGEIKYTWGTQLSADAKIKLKKVLGISGSYQYDDNGNLTIKYNGEVAVAYKYFNISKSDKKLVKNLCKKKIAYFDQDGDSYGNDSNYLVFSPKDPLPDGYVLKGGDCLDTNPDVFPGQSNYFTAQRGDGSFDYDCDGVITLQWKTTGACGKGHAEPQGWWGPTPDPGVTMAWLKDCDRKIGGTKKEFEQRTQGGK